MHFWRHNGYFDFFYTTVREASAIHDISPNENVKKMAFFNFKRIS